MKSFAGFVIKEFYHILRDYRTLLILFGMPVVQLTLFGFAIRNEVEDVKIAFVDTSNDRVAREIQARIEASRYFGVVDYLDDADAVQADFENGSIKAAILFEPGFAQRLAHDGVADVRIITDATDPNTAKTIESYATAIIQSYQSEQLGNGPIHISTDVRMWFNPELESVNLFVPGLIALILMLVCALMTSITITREKEMGTMEVLLVSPLRPLQIIVGKVVPYFFLSFVNVLTILVLARLVFSVPVIGSVPLLLAECLLFILCALSLGILISARSSSQQTATMISLAGLLLPTVILSGFIFPIASMPEPLQWISHIVPAKWFLIIIRGIMLKGVGIACFWKETLILAGMTLVLMAASIRSFSIRLE
jgi:ABC-2 type transport system permease protein